MKFLNYLLLAVLLVLSQGFDANGQLLSPNRAKHLKECAVRISIDGSPSVGTGFIAGIKGEAITCWHVIRPFLIADSLGKITGFRKIFVEFENGTKIEYGVPTAALKANGQLVMEQYDVCIIIPVKPLGYQTPALKLGAFSNVQEGDEIVTCGYPFGQKRQFLSRGMIASKYIDTMYIRNNVGLVTSKKPVNIALMDVTLNKGNSGGAIYKIGDTEAQDEVIGIADFILTPVGNDVNVLLENLKASNKNGQILLQGIDTNASLGLVIETLSNMSDGVSGCISVEYIQTLSATFK
jgi:serine protease Do